jgi:hypothetical protein
LTWLETTYFFLCHVCQSSKESLSFVVFSDYIILWWRHEMCPYAYACHAPSRSFFRAFYDLFILTGRAERAVLTWTYSSCMLSGMFIKRSSRAMSFITISQTGPFRLYCSFMRRTRLGAMLQFLVLNNAIIIAMVSIVLVQITTFTSWLNFIFFIPFGFFNS